MAKEYSMQEYVHSVSRRDGNLKETNKQKMRDQNHCNKWKNAFDGLRRLDIAERRISGLENISIKISKTETEGEQRLKK